MVRLVGCLNRRSAQSAPNPSDNQLTLLAKGGIRGQGMAKHVAPEAAWTVGEKTLVTFIVFSLGPTNGAFVGGCAQGAYDGFVSKIAGRQASCRDNCWSP